MAIVQGRMAVNPSVTCAEIDDEAVLLNVEAGIYFGLNALGTRIWGLLAQGASEGEIYNTLLTKYGVEPGRLRSDISRFLAVLAEKGLAEIVEE